MKHSKIAGGMRCSCCKWIKPLEQFDLAHQSGRQHYCRQCKKAYNYWYSCVYAYVNTRKHTKNLTLSMAEIKAFFANTPMSSHFTFTNRIVHSYYHNIDSLAEYKRPSKLYWFIHLI